jgi:hypothetical protein
MQVLVVLLPQIHKVLVGNAGDRKDIAPQSILGFLR